MRKILALIILVALTAQLHAGELLAYRDSVKDGYNFLLYVPDSYRVSDETCPVVIFLHGKSLCGNNLDQITRYGCIDALRRGVRIDALVLCPQCSNPSGWEASSVMATLEYVAARYRIDTDRIYVYGMSMGGWGTFKVVSAYPDRIAAAIAMCGGYTGSPEPLTQVPLWIIHGIADDITPLSNSKGIVKDMEETGNAVRLRYTWLQGCDHSILARAFLLDQTYSWLSSHRLSAEGRPVCTDYDVTPEDLRNAYRGLRAPGADLPIKEPRR